MKKVATKGKKRTRVGVDDSSFHITLFFFLMLKGWQSLFRAGVRG